MSTSTAAQPPPPPPPPPPPRSPSTAELLPTFRVGSNGLAPIPGAEAQFANVKKNLAGPGNKPSLSGGLKTRRRFKKKRLMSRKYCKKTPCRRMGFTQKASCRPYKNCYTRKN
jgi:hypothetical protein